MFQNNLGGDALPGSHQSYPSLFQPGAEFPRFDTPHRWLEDDVNMVFWTFNIPDISLVIRYGLFRDPNFPRQSLLNRPAYTIDAFLKQMLQPCEQQLLGNLSHVQKVEEILRRSSTPAVELVPWSWLPPPPGHSLDAQAIAEAIEAESCSQFSRIAFEEVVRASLGYSAPSVEWFLRQHSALYIHLLNHLQTYSEELPVYVEVETHLRTWSPFAYRALVQCLKVMQPDATIHDAQKQPGFAFVADPVQRLFQEQPPPSLTTILKVLSVLAIRFKREYIHSSRMDWECPFDTKIPLLTEFLNSTSPEDLADTLINTDEVYFAEILQQKVAAGKKAECILAKWHALSISVWDCCLALPDVTPSLQECALVLLSKGDYHSFTAILNGLQKYAISTACVLNTTGGDVLVLELRFPAEATALLNSARNYNEYRQRFWEDGRFPFLPPHRVLGETCLEELFYCLVKSLSARSG